MKRLLGTVAALLLIGLAERAPAQDAVPGLGGLVGLLPEAADIYEAAPIFTYVDMRAMERAAGVATPESEAAYDAWPREQQGAWVDATWRLAVGPEWLSQYFASRGPGPESMAETVGFDMFAIDRSFGFGQPPGQVLVLAGDTGLADPGRLQAALEPRGFALRQIGGISVWHRFKDFEINLRERFLSDPFGGPLGKAARIAVLPHMLVSAPSWALLEAVLAAPRTEQRGGALPAMLRAAVAAVETYASPDAVLVQALALPLAATADTPPVPALIGLQDPAALADVLKAQIAAGPAGPALPPYPLSLLADLQVGADQVNLIVLPYADAAAAEAAAGVLADRLRGWTITRHDAEETLVARVGGAVEAKTVAGDGIVAAVVAVRYPMPDAAAEDEKPGAVLRAWVQAVFRREFTPLALID